MGFRVRATQLGIFGLPSRRYREGDVFEIDHVGQFSEKWMEWIDKPEEVEAISEAKEEAPKAKRGRKPKAEKAEESPTPSEETTEPTGTVKVI